MKPFIIALFITFKSKPLSLQLGMQIIRSLLVVSLLGASTAIYAKRLPLEKLNLPEGFVIEKYADVPNARQMNHGGDGVVYVGTRKDGDVYAVVDNNGDGKSDAVHLIDDNLNMPSGLAYKDGDLYVGAVSEILVYRNIDSQLQNPPKPEVLTDQLPDKRHHGWKYLGFGPDGKLYIPVGAPCNICLSDNPQFASILRMDINNPALLESFASGIRNTVGFDWHPTTGELWFTDNGRDMMGDDLPPGELNKISKRGQHFGYPFFHAGSIPDPKFGKGKLSDDYVHPALKLDPHVAALGIKFYLGNMFPKQYHEQVFMAEHGSWNRSKQAGHTGHRITVARKDSKGDLVYETLVDGWLQNNKAWGRPVDVLELSDGSMLISDDKAGVIYRLSYVSP
ncbi:PQQ-dependent sugar dehydrogenase [Pseudomonadales bacterium]|nr:PQQ-dependent sugar dehydrogenase [Pseudomonadales bacterium]|tara:strand:- start:542 stop:1723 length:1182 start_codon:yes stop_codon:yes gene_type:complete